MKHILALPLLLTVTAFAGYSHQSEATRANARERSLPDCRVSPALVEKARGLHDAKADVARGELTILTIGMQVRWSREYTEIMARDYQIAIRPVAGCVVTAAQVEYTTAYNEVMTQQIEKRFGPDVFATARKAAEALHAQRHAPAETE